MDYIDERVINEALYIIDTDETVREIAKIFNVSKSTIHKDLHDRLKDIDYDLYIKVTDILNNHYIEKHIRGGEATRIKYLKL
ncbi:MAG: sporulation transcriptional regulator SpoIIID [Bacilli bacterium]|nr:sporulation transcriptional regulator SpoIIID [Bacilli bacterium]